MKLITKITLFLFVFCSSAILHDAFGQEQDNKKAEKISLLDRLLMHEFPQVEIATNVQTVYDDWQYQSYHWGFAKISLTEEERIEEEIDVKIRGKFRSRFCENPPIKLKFSNKRLSARNLKKLNEFKVVYPCKSNQKFQTYVLKEYLTYKLFNVLSDHSLRAQLVDLMLVDSAKTVKDKHFAGFLLEHEEELIDRLGVKKSNTNCIRPDHLHPYDHTLFQVFQYAIGNTDWVLPTCHNAEIISTGDKQMIVVPYDFDFSGIVATDYAKPASNLSILTVQERYFLGDLKSMEELDPILALFQEKRDELTQTIETFSHLSKPERKRMVGYLNSFYKIIDNPKKVKKIFIKPAASNDRK